MALEAPLYTGQNTGVNLQGTGELEAARGRLNQNVLQGQQMQMQVRKEERDSFLEAIDTESVALVSENLLDRQTELLEEYNTKWANRYQQSKGSLSMKDKVEMQADKQRIDGWQKRKLAENETWKEYKYKVLNDTRGYYDKEHFEEAERLYKETGELPVDALKPRPRSFSAYVRNRPKRTGSTLPDPEIRVVNIDGKKHKVTTRYNVTEEEARVWAFQDLMNDELSEAFLSNAIKDFSKLPAEKKKEYMMDFNNDGSISDDEMERSMNEPMDGMNNPIVRFEIDRSWQDYLQPSESLPSGLSSGSASSKGRYYIGGSKFNVGDIAGTVQIGPNTYHSHHSFIDSPLVNIHIPATAKFLGVAGETPVGTPKNVQNVALTGYDEQTGTLFISTSKDTEVGAWWDDNNIAVPIEDVDDMYKDLQVDTKDGVKTIREIIKEGGEQSTGVDFSSIFN